MTIIPNFLLKKLYIMGSLRVEGNNVVFDFFNSIGPGLLTRIGSIQLNETQYLAEQILFVIDGSEYEAAQVTEETPLHVAPNKKITCILKETAISPGSYDICLNVTSKEAGNVSVSVKDTLQ